MLKERLLLLLLSLSSICFSQIVLKADGKSDTHQLITKAFAIGYKPIESSGFKKR